MQIKLSGFSDEISPKVTEQFTHLNKLGIKYFEPRGIDGKNIADLNDDEVNALKETMRTYGISASSIGSPIGKIGIEDDFDEHLVRLRRVIRTAKMLDTNYIRVFSFFVPSGSAQKYRDKVLFRMQSMAKEAQSEGVMLLHENEKDIYGDTAERCKDIFESVASPNLRAVFDAANFVQCGETVYPTAYNLLGDYIEYVHIKDAKRDGTVVPASQGDGRLCDVLSALNRRNYSGFLSLEPHLGSFEGLAALEKDDKMLGLDKSDRSTFTLAYNSLMNILKDVTDNG